MSLSLYDLWLSMGPFAKSIVVIMAVMSVLSWTAAFRKWSQLYKSQRETKKFAPRSEEHTSELQSRPHLVCRLLLEKKNTTQYGESMCSVTRRSAAVDLRIYEPGRVLTYV